LRFAPLWLLSALCGKDRRFDPLEEDALWHAIDEVLPRWTGFAHTVLSATAANPSATLPDYERDRRPIVTGLWDVMAVLDRCGEIDSADFRAALMQVGERIGLARGPFGQSVNREDAKSLVLIAEVLGLDPAEPAGMETPSP
jgi:hypothetical protein